MLYRRSLPTTPEDPKMRPFFAPSHEIRYIDETAGPDEIVVPVEVIEVRSSTIEILQDDPDGRPSNGDEIVVLDEEGNEFVYRYVVEGNEDFWVCLGEKGFEEEPTDDTLHVGIFDIIEEEEED